MVKITVTQWAAKIGEKSEKSLKRFEFEPRRKGP